MHLLKYFGLFIFSVLVLIAFLATVLPLFASKEWYIRIFDYPRLQTFFIAVGALAWFLIFYFTADAKGYLVLAVLAGIIIVQAYKAFPYTPLGSKQVLTSEKDLQDTMNISLLICNVYQPNTAYDKVLERVKSYQPDLFITTESNQRWQEALSPIEKEYPYRVQVPQENTYGMHLYSRLPLEQTSVRNLVDQSIPSIRTKVQLRSGEWVHLFILHPRPPVPGEESDSKERDAEIILIGKEARKENGGVIVAGDFNDVAWSETTELFQRVTGYLDPRRGRGFYNTFHAKYPIFRWPLDHIFHSVHFKLVTMERLDPVNSDHFPIFIKLSYEPAETNEQKAVQKERDTEKEAIETIQQTDN